MLNLTFATKPVFGAKEAAIALAQVGKPQTSDFNKANSFKIPCGAESACGYLFMLRKDLDAIDLNALHSLTFTLLDKSNVVIDTRTWRNLVIAKEPLNLTPSNVADDPNSLYLVEIADARWRVHNPGFWIAANKLYNVSSNASNGASGPTAYLATSLNGGTTPWTWSELAGDLWGLMSAQLGSYPGLPFTPNGTPIGWIFEGVSAWKSLNQILDRIGCTIVPDLTQESGQYDIVQVGADDTTSDDVLAAADLADRKIHDAEYLPIIRGKLPYGVRVQFHKQLSAPTGIPPWLLGLVPYTVDIVGDDSASAEPAVYHPIWDDMPALYDATPTLTNGAALATRAQERADDYFRRASSTGGERLWKRYSGLLHLNPGSTVKSVQWYCGTEVFTDVLRFPALADVGMDYADAGTVWDLVRLGFPAELPECCTTGDGEVINSIYYDGLEETHTFVTPCRMTVFVECFGKGGSPVYDLDDLAAGEGYFSGGGGGGAYAASILVLEPGTYFLTDDTFTDSDANVLVHADSGLPGEIQTYLIAGGGSPLTAAGGLGGTAAASVGQFISEGGTGGDGFRFGDGTAASGSGGGRGGRVGDGDDGNDGVVTAIPVVGGAPGGSNPFSNVGPGITMDGRGGQGFSTDYSFVVAPQVILGGGGSLLFSTNGLYESTSVGGGRITSQSALTKLADLVPTPSSGMSGDDGTGTGLTLVVSGAKGEESLTLGGILDTDNGGFGADVSAYTGLPIFTAGVVSDLTSTRANGVKLQTKIGTNLWAENSSSSW